MRAGWLVSLIGHVGAALMTSLAWQCSAESLPSSVGAGVVVPVEIVDVAIEDNVRALSDDAPADEFEAVAPAAGQPEPAPGAQRPNPQQTRSFNPNQSEALLKNTEADDRPRPTNGAPGPTRPGAGAGTLDQATLETMLRSETLRHLQRCWRSNVDARDPIIVTLRFALDREGRIAGEIQLISPRESNFMSGEQRAAIANARRAARLCEPYPFPTHAVLREHYNLWRLNNYRFGEQ
jgi:hypothetical protein